MSIGYLQLPSFVIQFWFGFDDFKLLPSAPEDMRAIVLRAMLASSPRTAINKSIGAKRRHNPQFIIDLEACLFAPRN